MGIREKAERVVTAQLQPGEQLLALVPAAQTGPSPWLTSSFGLLGATIGYVTGARNYGLALTDQRVLRLRRNFASGRLADVDAQAPRSQFAVLEWREGQVWSVLRLRQPDGEVRYNVHRKWRSDAAALASALGTGAAAS